MNTLRVLTLAALGLTLLTGCQTGSRSISRGSAPGSESGTGQSTKSDYVWNGWDKALPGPDPLGYPDSPSYRWIR